MFPLAAPVTRFPHTILPECWVRSAVCPTTGHFQDPLAALASCFPALLGAETGQTPRQAPVRWTPMQFHGSSPIVARC